MSSVWTCNTDGRTRTRCVAGHVSSEVCVNGCLRGPAGTDDVCALTAMPWSENFEAVTWDQIGSGTLPDGIVLWDVGSPALHTAVFSGAGSQRALGWYGGGAPAHATYPVPEGGVPEGSAYAALPPMLDGNRDVVFEFDALGAATTIIHIMRGGCPHTSYTVNSVGPAWSHHAIRLRSCGVRSGVVLRVGSVYATPAGAEALRLDNMTLSYP